MWPEHYGRSIRTLTNPCHSAIDTGIAEDFAEILDCTQGVTIAVMLQDKDWWQFYCEVEKPEFAVATQFNDLDVSNEHFFVHVLPVDKYEFKFKEYVPFLGILIGRSQGASKKSRMKNASLYAWYIRNAGTPAATTWKCTKSDTDARLGLFLAKKLHESHEGCRLVEYSGPLIMCTECDALFPAGDIGNHRHAVGQSYCPPHLIRAAMVPMSTLCLMFLPSAARYWMLSSRSAT